MISIKQVASLFILPLIMLNFSRCSSQKKLQDKAPVKMNQVYFQSWIAGVQGGGSGLNVFIPLETVSAKTIALDSVYFRGKAAKLETKPQDKTLYIGRFDTDLNKKKDMIMNADGKAEYGNEMPIIPQKIPFDLKDNECVISYKEGQKTKYFKVDSVIEKEQIAYPSAPPNKQ